MKLLFMTNVPSPYRVDFFNELGKHCDLTVTFEKRTSDERDSSWKDHCFNYFQGVFLKGKSVSTDTALCLEVLKYVSDRSFDCVICADFTSPTGMIAIQYMKMHKIAYWLESDGGFAKDGKGIKEKIKKHLITGADGYFSTSKENDRYYTAYGANPDKIYRYPFTSLHEDDILKDIPSMEEKKQLRYQLGVTEEKMVVSVGQFIYRKGFDILINTAAKLDPSIGVYIIGGSPTQEYIDLKEDCKADNVHFVGFKSKSELTKWYRAADLFVLPTREDIWGLVINEAMANGLPVITTDRCIAGLELVEQGESGYIVPVGDINALIDKIQIILQNINTIQFMQLQSLRKIVMYTIEYMVLVHLDVINSKYNQGL